MTLLQKLKNQLYRLPNNLAILGIHLYRLLLSPSVGLLRYIPFYPRPSCIFYPTCSEYSIECFKKYSFFRAVYTTTKRIGRCHPGNDPQIDLP